MELSRRNRSLMAALACASRPGGRARRRPRLPPPLAPARRSSAAAAPIPAQWPFAVAIFRKGHMHCSGSVIGPTKVLTAGHCVAGFNLANFQVIIGRPTLRDAAVGQVIGVTSGRVHPDFEQTGPARRGGAQSRPADERDAGRAGDARAERRDHAGRRPAAGGGLRGDQPFGVHLSRLPQDDDRAIAHRQPLPEGLHARPVRAREHDLRARGDARRTRAASRSTPRPARATAAVRWSPTPPTGPVEVGTVSYGGALCGLPAAPTVYSRVAVEPGLHQRAVAATRPLHLGAKGEARSDLCGAAACRRGYMAKPSIETQRANASCASCASSWRVTMTRSCICTGCSAQKKR